jgi:glycogen synthase
MKVCLITNLYGANARGGAERIVEAEARHLAAAGHDVLVIAGWAGYSKPADIAADGIRVLRLRPHNLFFYTDLVRHGWPARLLWHFADTFNFRTAAAVRKILSREKPDIVHTHNLMGLGFLIPHSIRRLGLRHVHTVHDVQLVHPSGLVPAAGRLPGGSHWHAALLRRIFGSPATVIFPSQFLKGFYERFGFFPASNRRVLPNPAPSGERRPRSGLPDTAFLFAGQLERHKGIIELIEAWRKWPGSGDARLEIAGSGSCETEARRSAAGLKNVFFLGRLDAAGIGAALARSAYLVVPSLVMENYPTVIIEAFSAGTPVLGAAAGGIPELVSDGQNGFLFAPGDVVGLAAAFDRAVRAMPGWPRFSDEARRRVAGNGIEAHVEALTDIYRSGDRQ